MIAAEMAMDAAKYRRFKESPSCETLTYTLLSQWSSQQCWFSGSAAWQLPDQMALKGVCIRDSGNWDNVKGVLKEFEKPLFIGDLDHMLDWH